MKKSATVFLAMCMCSLSFLFQSNQLIAIDSEIDSSRITPLQKYVVSKSADVICDRNGSLWRKMDGPPLRPYDKPIHVKEVGPDFGEMEECLGDSGPWICWHFTEFSEEPGEYFWERGELQLYRVYEVTLLRIVAE